MTLIDVTISVDVEVRRELFPPPLPQGKFAPLFLQHATEVRGKPFCLNYSRLYQIELENRLVWIVARNKSEPIGYSLHFWYQDLHFGDRLASDDLWFVLRDFRGKGIGGRLKELGHACLKKEGALRTSDTIRSEFDHPTLMTDLGFSPWGTRWTKDL